MTDWQQVQGSQDFVSEFDSDSSKVYVYQRKNIERATVETEGIECKFWQYDERKLTREEYAQMKIAALEEENTNLQLALTDLYENLLEG